MLRAGVRVRPPALNLTRANLVQSVVAVATCLTTHRVVTVSTRLHAKRNGQEYSRPWKNVAVANVRSDVWRQAYNKPHVHGW